MKSSYDVVKYFLISIAPEVPSIGKGLPLNAPIIGDQNIRIKLCYIKQIALSYVVMFYFS
jgi:hypothetical protein